MLILFLSFVHKDYFLTVMPRPHQRQCRQKRRHCRQNSRQCRQKRRHCRQKPRHCRGNRRYCRQNGNNIEAILSKQLLVFNPVAMPPPKVQKYGPGDGSMQWRPRAEPL